jgi:hypothetical protein
MATDFSFTRYMPVTSDGDRLDVFNSQFRNLRYAIPVEKRIVLSVAHAQNAPGLAHRFLGDAGLWWAILHFNGLKNPRTDLYPGRTINIPNRQALLSFLETPSSSTTQVEV